MNTMFGYEGVLFSAVTKGLINIKMSSDSENIRNNSFFISSF